MDMDMGGGEPAPKPDGGSYPPTYFSLPDYGGLMYAHIALMVLGWVFALPVGQCCGCLPPV